MATDKQGLTIEVTTYHGAPREGPRGWTRESFRVTALVMHGDVTVDPYDAGAADPVIRSFQLEHACKVAYLEDDSENLRSFDVFEPSWVDASTAQRMARELARRLVAATCGLTGYSGPLK